MTTNFGGGRISAARTRSTDRYVGCCCCARAGRAAAATIRRQARPVTPRRTRLGRVGLRFGRVRRPPLASDKRSDLPPMLPSMWRLCKLGYRFEPGLMLVAFGLALLMALPDALLALWFKLLGEAVLQRDAGLMRIAAFALGISATATWALGVL